MGAFLNDLITRHVDGQYVILEESLVYRTNSLVTIHVPQGFKTDYASIPRFFWRFCGSRSGDGPKSNYAPASVLHDFMYETGMTPYLKVTRRRADNIFYEAMLCLKVSRWRAWLMYKAVRLCGWFPWNRYRKRHLS